MEAAIDNDSHLLSRSLITQFTVLIIDPLVWCAFSMRPLLENAQIYPLMKGVKWRLVTVIFFVVMHVNKW